MPPRHSVQRNQAATRNSILGGAGLGAVGYVAGRQSVQPGRTTRLPAGLAASDAQVNARSGNQGGYPWHPLPQISGLRSARDVDRTGHLARQNALDARLMGLHQAVPEWASTHPVPASRVRAALARAGSDSHGITNRDTFLTRVNGLVFGDDPERGVVDGRMFTHSGLRLHFEVPAGYYPVNGTRAVAIDGQSGKGQFASGALTGISMPKCGTSSPADRARREANRSGPD